MIDHPSAERPLGATLRAALPAILTVLILALPAPAGAAEGPPPTRRDEVRELIHGVEIVDPYRWLEAQDSPETHAWIAAQNAYTRSLLADLPWRPAIRQRLEELIRVDRVEMPIQRQGRLFVWKTRAEDELPILYLRQGLTGRDEVLIDPHTLSADHTVSVTIVGISRDGKLLAYGVRDGGEDEVTVRVLDVDARRDLPDRLPRGLYFGAAFTADPRGFYYARRDRETGARIYFHRLGSDPAADVEIFGRCYEPDKGMYAELSDSGRYLLISVYHGWTKVELHFRDLAADGPIRPLVTGVEASFYPQFAGDRLVVLTDWQAPNRRLVAIDLERPQRDAWREIVPPGPDAIEDFSLAGGRVFVHYLHNVASQLKVFDLDGNARGEVNLPGLGSASVPSGRWDDATAFYDFRSFTTPRTIFRLDVETGRSSEWARDAVPFDPQDYEVRQVWYSSKDGTRVPMFLVHRRGLEPNGGQPTALFGYGGFGHSVTPWFSLFASLWLERGGLFAVANVRGGGEFGEAWHRAGMLENKQNAFDDFIAAAEWLIDNRYTNPRKLAILGASNGGLLVGAAMTQRPDLFQAVLCVVPDLDMVRYHEFENNNPPALLEYGNAADPEQFKFLYAYSPYHHVRKGTEYPAVLLTTGHNDTRVPPLQARKMTALLQYATASQRPILLHYDMRAGHAGGGPAATAIDDVARDLSFLVWQLGMEPLALPAPSPAGTAQGPPPTRREEVRELIHGVEIVDPYRWLEAQESPETHAWIAAQNAYTQSLLADLPWRPAIRQRLEELMRVDRVEMPIQRRGRLFVWKARAEDELPILYLRQGLTGRDEVLIDPHSLSADHTVSVTILAISRDGKLLAYGVRDGGEDEVTVHFMDVDARRDLPDRLPRGIYTGVAFTADNRGFYYGRHDREIGDRIYYHQLGSDPAADVEIFGQGYGPDTWISPELSDSGRYLLIGVYHGWTKVELHFRDLATDGPIRPLVTGIDASFLPRFAGDRLVVLTDWQAPNRRLLAIDLERPQRDAWREIVPPGPDAIEGFSLAGGRVFVHYLHNVTSQLKVFDLDGNARGEVALPGLGSASVPAGRWDEPTAFYDFRSFTTPRTILRLDVATGRSSEWARDAVPFDPQDYEVRQVWYSSKDGTRVPMFLVHRRGLERNGRQPTALYGYGCCSVSLTPWFSLFAVPWIERGGLFAVANIRGGGEFGEAWHRAGMLENKQNAFDDFIAAAEWLIENRYTSPRKLAIMGGSNGGLLVGAAMTQRPELFQAVLCLVPDLDIVRYPEFENNNPPAVLEYGNAADPEQFPFVYAYSPYQNVWEGTEYPAVLLTTGHNDTRVPPLQARKMTALLQYATASERPILLHYDMRAGHAGGGPASTATDDVARDLSFLVWQLGMEPRGWEDASTAPLKARAPGFPPPAEAMELAVAGYAKVLCSAVFVSGREAQEAARNSAFFTVPEAERPLVRWTVDREKQEVEASWYELTRRARFYGDQGCVILPRGADGVFFTPVPVRTTLPDAATQPWPMGDRDDGEPLPPEVDAEALAAAVETAFADPEALTAAFLVVYRGRIIAERYGLGVDKDTQLESWSMGKSLTATLVGLLVQDGTLDLDQPAPVAAWQSADDPRSAIRGIDLLQMSGGLHFVAPQDPDYSPALGYADHMYIYTGAVDVFEYAISRPLQFPPGTEGRYRNSDPLILGYLVREAVRARGEEYLTFPQRALFDRIGIRRQVLETDPYGNFVLTGYDYGTARGWARLGLLYLQDGTWQGERLLPEGWAELVSTPAPGWDEPIYGGLFWLLRSGVVLPADAYFMAGAGGQRTVIVPSLDLVIVRMGHQRGNQRGMELLDQALARLLDAIDFENRGPRER